MNYSFATEDNGPEIKQLLTDSDLHHEDITTAQLKHFLLEWDGPKLVAVVGLEIKNHSALLRSLAVDADYRNRRIATRLIGEIEDYAKSMEVDTLYLLTLTAEAFFKKCGSGELHGIPLQPEFKRPPSFEIYVPRARYAWLGISALNSTMKSLVQRTLV